MDLHISLPHDQQIPGESLATAVIHAMDFLSIQSNYGHGFDELTRQGLAWNHGPVDIRARSQLPPMQTITKADLSRILRIVWDLAGQHG